MLHKNIVLLILTLALVSCNQKRDEAYYLTHPDKLGAAIENCRALDNYTFECDAVRAARTKLNVLLLQAHASGQAFGRTILQLQMQRAELQKSFVKATATEKYELRQNINKLNLEVGTRIAVVRLLEPL